MTLFRTTTPDKQQSRESTAKAIVAADEAHVRDAIESVKWEERGFLRRLVRVDSGRADA
jgi:hypothetical protein